MQGLIESLIHSIRKSEPIESFEHITIRIMGMRQTIEYEVLMKDRSVEVSRYGIRYEDGKDKRIVELKNTCEKERILKLMNECDLLSWDGFKGEHPKGVLDGTMFNMDAIINSKKIHASGSENFPKHYHEFTNELFQIAKLGQEDE